ncbi:MmcQ/YjbR family DNA-binding protein [Streptomyces fractus]|uniref:MmcQ/YjbR family DNA-binding protein n=1 Tax=Streptomyces fractus TaxID=641806 RepID=UPI003CEDF0E8
MTAAGDRLQETARNTALALPGVTHGRPFVEKLDVYKVAGKVFLIVTDDPNDQIVTVKCEPDHGHTLRNQYSTVTPGRYLDKRHWISVGAGRGITREFVAEGVRHSYELVLDTLPRRDRPVPTVGDGPA